ncbi:ferritin-like domain-containing protein [Cupriavidus basilensis]
MRRQALAILCLSDAHEKAAATRRMRLAAGAMAPEALGIGEAIAPNCRRPAGRRCPNWWRRSGSSGGAPSIRRAGRAALIHALAHIEFNAINLALDAIWRFDAMPVAFYLDRLRVADEEALHFRLLAQHLVTLDARYGDFPAHNSLWEMADKTAGDVLARMALVPRTLEARGLDASPPVRAKLAAAGDHEAATIIDIILRDEVGHVAIGNRWYRWLCALPRPGPRRHLRRAGRAVPGTAPAAALPTWAARARRVSTRMSWRGWRDRPVSCIPLPRHSPACCRHRGLPRIARARQQARGRQLNHPARQQRQGGRLRGMGAVCGATDRGGPARADLRIAGGATMAPRKWITPSAAHADTESKALARANGSRSAKRWEAARPVLANVLIVISCSSLT